MNLKNVAKEKKRHRPSFRRQNSTFLTKFKKKGWRRPMGSQNKTRRGEKGKQAMPKIGYSMPRAFRSMHPSGLRDVLVHTVDELQKMDAKSDAARIAAVVGARKKKEIIEKAKELKIKILNP